MRELFITRIKRENKELKQEVKEWVRLNQMQNEREYRSKFLKEFQAEYGELAYPDYDEIYERYDKLKEENKNLKEQLERWLQ